MQEDGAEIKEAVTSENKFLKKIVELTQSIVNESRLPTKEALGYDSTVGVYGGKLVEKGGKLIYQTTGIVSQADRISDWVLRSYDEHIMQNPDKMLRKHPTQFFRGVLPGPLRYRGKPSEIAENARRLGLGDVYTLHPEGIEIKKPEVLKSGYVLQDIYRQDQIGNEILSSIDRFSALAEAGKYIRSTHDQYGAIGELLASDIIFQQLEGGKPEHPILNLPDELYNPKKIVSETTKKATDILDFLVSIGFEELRRSNDWNKVKQALNSLLVNYGDVNVIKAAESFAKRGRLIMTSKIKSPTEKGRPFFALHNQARLDKIRLGFNEQDASLVRQLIITTCAEILPEKPITTL